MKNNQINQEELQRLLKIINNNLDELLKACKKANKGKPLRLLLLQYLFDKAKWHIEEENKFALLIVNKYNSAIFLLYSELQNWSAQNKRPEVPYYIVDQKIRAFKSSLSKAVLQK